MKRKMHDLARAGKCAGRGCNGLSFGVAAEACRVKKPSPSSKPVRARPVKPAPICQRNSRREPAQRDEFAGVEFTVLFNNVLTVPAGFSRQQVQTGTTNPGARLCEPQCLCLRRIALNPHKS